MYKQKILFALLLWSIISFSQEIVNSVPVALKKNKSIFQVVNEASKETTLFVGDQEKVKAFRLNSEMKIIDSISAIRLNAKLYSTMIGYNENKSNTNLVWSSSNHKDIFIQQFNFDKLNSENKTFTLTLKDEKYVQNFSQNGRFYLMTVIKSSDKLKLYVFDTDGKLEERTIDLKGLEFLSFDNKKTTLYEKLKEEFNGTDFPFSMQLIRSENPTSLVESAKKRKCYSNGTSIVITFDSNLDFTQLITINLENFSAKQYHINKPIIPGDKAEQNSNSFFIDNHLYQIKTSSSFLIFTVKDLEDNLIKSYKASDKKPIIDFKNNDYVQENGDTANTRILETASQFIRKTNNLNSGISCYKLNDNYLVTIGSISGQQDASASIFLGGMMGGIIGAVAVAAANSAISNPTLNSFNAYSNKKVVYMSGLFDKDNNHIKGDIDALAFDKIRTFFDHKKDVSSPTLYKMDNIYYFGYYDNTTKEYTIRKFKD